MPLSLHPRGEQACFYSLALTRREHDAQNEGIMLMRASKHHV